MARTARQVALDALVSFAAGGVFSQSRFAERCGAAGLDRRDAAFASFLVGGVLQNLRLCDWHIAKHSNIPLKKMETKVLCILRLGTFQLFFAAGVPARAAVNESVALCGRNKRAAGFCNAVLRAVSRTADPYAVEIADPMERLGIVVSCPDWIVREAAEQYGLPGAESLLWSLNETPKTTLQLNPMRTTPEEAVAFFAAEGVEAAPHLFLPMALELSSAATLSENPVMAAGGGWVQDAAAFLAAKTLDPHPGERILDLCAAPGGKSFAAAALTGGEALITACDISERKLKLVSEGAERLGFSNIRTEVSDATVFRPEFEGKFDRLICDLPCSGLGILRRKPDIRYKPETDAIALPALQLSMLRAAARYLKPGGVMLYSTCTWREEENAGVVQAFLEKEHFSLKSFQIPEIGQLEQVEMLTLRPDLHGTDGFYICLLRKSDV